MIGGGGNIQERKIQPRGWDDICEAKQQGHRGVCTKQWDIPQVCGYHPFFSVIVVKCILATHSHNLRLQRVYHLMSTTIITYTKKYPPYLEGREM